MLWKLVQICDKLNKQCAVMELCNRKGSVLVDGV
jgi:hypothetical protein